MNKRCTVRATMVGCDMDVDVVEWAASDPFPALGSSVGVDTETELITDTVLFPKLVVLGVFSPKQHTCYIIYHKDAPAFMNELCKRNIQQRYFNLGFDEGVLDNECPDKPLLEAIDSGRVRDMQIRAQLNCIATDGYIDGHSWSLAGCSSKYLRYTLDKGDGTENSARLSFKRGAPVTDEQAVYLPFDCITTWALGEVLPEQPIDPVSKLSIEVGHAKGMCVLAHIQANGFSVDPVVHKWFTDKLLENKQKYRDMLLTFGFPDPEYEPAEEKAEVIQLFKDGMHNLLGDEQDWEVPAKVVLKRMLAIMWNHSGFAGERKEMLDELRAAYLNLKPLRKVEETNLNDMIEKCDIGAFVKSTKALVLAAFVGVCLREVVKQATEGKFDMAEAARIAAEWLDDRPTLTSTDKLIGPKEFFQEHVKDLLRANCSVSPEEVDAIIEGKKQSAEQHNKTWTETDALNALMGMSKLKLETTKKTGDIQLTLKDMWRLQDVGIEDKFLEAYTKYKHCEKYLSTYMDPKYVKEDGKVHAKYTNLVRTGRTSCQSPNIL